MNSTLWLTAAGSTLAWSTFDAIRKKLVKQVSVASLSLWMSLAQVPGYLIWMAFQQPAVPGADYWPPALASIALNLLANLLFLYAVSVAELSVAIPILSFTPVFVAIGGGPLLGEYLEPAQWVGVLLVTFGALLLHAPAEARRRPQRLLLAFFQARGVLPMLGVALLWALTPIFDKMALQSLPVTSQHALVLALGVAAGMAAYLAARGQLVQTAPRGRDAWTWLAFGGAANVLALGLQLLAISAMVVSVFEAFKRAAGLLLAVALGAAFFRERLTVGKLLSGLLMGAGVVLVLVGIP